MTGERADIGDILPIASGVEGRPPYSTPIRSQQLTGKNTKSAMYAVLSIILYIGRNDCVTGRSDLEISTEYMDCVPYYRMPASLVQDTSLRKLVHERV